MPNNVNQYIWKLISQDFSVQKDLKRGLINVRALAKHLIETHHIEASLDAVISAIRRYELPGGLPEMREEVDEVLKEIEVFTRDHVAGLRVNSHRLPKMFMHENFPQIESNFRIIKSKKHAIVLLNERELDKVKTFFSKADIIHVKQGLAELRVVMPLWGRDVRGTLSRILNEIALRGVSIRDLIVCYPDVLIYVDRKSILKAHHAVLALHDEAQKE